RLLVESHTSGVRRGPSAGLEQADAANRMAGFVIVAVVTHPAGGWFSDGLGPIPVLTVVYAARTAGPAVQSFTPDLRAWGTIVFLSMAAALGAGSGATFAWWARWRRPARAARSPVWSVLPVVWAGSSPR